MKLVIIRHGDPDYANDTLTPTGHTEAALIAERIAQMDVAAFYVSPLGRARDTAQYTLDKMGRQAEILPWLREFHAPILHPDTNDTRVPWDWLPAVWTKEPAYYDKDSWAETDVMREYHVGEEYRRVCAGLDALLAKHGYVREGMVYRTERPNRDTIVLFCHFGLECVLLSHLIGVSPMVLWHGLCAAPTSMTVVCTEERRPGTASFRISHFGDTGHLYIAGQAPSFSAKFRETYDSDWERRD